MRASPRHRILVVEDNPEMAEEIGDRLQMLGYDYVIATTLEEAVREIEAGNICLVLLDLHLKVHARSMVAEIGVGLQILRLLREKFHERNGDLKFVVQVIVMTGHGKDRTFMREAFQLDANDFLVKPFSDNEISLEDTIRKCFRKAARIDHAHCIAGTSSVGMAEVQRVGAPSEPPASAPSRGTPSSRPPDGLTVEIRVTATPMGKRLELMVGGVSVPLRPTVLCALLWLWWARLTQPDAWLAYDLLDDNDIKARKLVSLLRDDLDAVLGFPSVETFEGEGRYRLSPRIVVTYVALDALSGIREARMQKVLAELRVAQCPPAASASPIATARRGAITRSP